MGYVESAVALGSPQRRHSREKPAESANWGEEGKGGALTVAAGSAPDPGEGRAPLCFAAVCSASVLELRGGRRRRGRCERDAPCSVPAPEHR